MLKITKNDDKIFIFVRGLCATFPGGTISYNVAQQRLNETFLNRQVLIQGSPPM
jgi:hypothetical protein